MKRAVPYIVAGVIAIVVAAYLVFFLDMTTKQGHEQLCSGMRVEVKDSVSMKFITAADVDSCIRLEYGQCIGMAVEKLDLNKLEDILRAKNAVLSSEAYITTDGVLNVEVIQRVPALRFKNDEDDFYLDSDGYVFHLQTVGMEKIITVGGSFPVGVDEDFQGVLAAGDGGKWLAAMLTFADCLKKTGMADGVTIFVRENGDIVLTPAEGHPQFIFGPPDNFGSKFDRLGKYWSAVVPKEGADTYSTVFLKYDGQLVCRRDGNATLTTQNAKTEFYM